METSNSSSLSSSKDAADLGSSVQVAVRIRPQGNREKLEGSRVCTTVIPNEPQVTIGSDRSFTYDYVFDMDTAQHTIYEKCIDKLVEGTFDGFNATVLAYGQTGSGKTHTMGTGFDTGVVEEEHIGVIPRAVNHVFRRANELREEATTKGKMAPSFEVAVQFIELYNEEIIDLLADERTTGGVRIHEDNRGEIVLHGVATKVVTDTRNTLETLKNGALNRTVGSTNMNEQSSRSHAIFSLLVKQQRMADVVEGETGEPEMEVLTAKFHFVDLAGSERLKRTGATGERAKEGISINCGLLALGNVISALGGASGKVSHVPYRDSKLTRLLQDSLGGNSRTLMIACVSPSDSDFVETLNTMKYANRAKNIKNKVVANQDKSSKLISELRVKIVQLENELMEFRQGRRKAGVDGEDALSDEYHENLLLTAEVNQLRFRVKALQETSEILRNRNIELLATRSGLPMTADGEEGGDGLARGYLEELETMRSALIEAHATCDLLRKECTRWKTQAMNGGGSSSIVLSRPTESLIEEARADIERMKRSMTSSSQDGTSDYASPNEVTEDERMSEEGEDEEDDDDDEGDAQFDHADKECTELQENLTDLQGEISIKERLIEELERSERRLNEVRLSYERKLTELSLRIKQTEIERDKVLADISNRKENKETANEASKKIREEYEAKLSNMRRELKKLEMLEKEHERMRRRQDSERNQLNQLQAELKLMKRTKVDLMKKMKEEAKRAQQQQMVNARKMATLDKESRRQQTQLQNLQLKDKQREIFIKRTTEEINRLRRTQRTGPVRNNVIHRPATSRVVLDKKKTKQQQAEDVFSLKTAVNKWKVVERRMKQLVNQRCSVQQMEQELERNMAERRRLIEETHQLEKKFARIADVTEREVLAELIDGCRQKMRYVQDEITEIQKTIVDYDGEKEEGEGERRPFDDCGSIVEAKYLMQHLFNYCLEQSVERAKYEGINKECEARIEQLEQQSFINEQLLSTVIEGDRNIVGEIEAVLESSNRKAGRPISLVSATSSSSGPTEDGHERLRKRTSNVEELLYPAEDNSEKHDEKRERRRVPFGRSSRLRATIAAPTRTREKEGCITAARGGEGTGDSLIRTHTLEGHTKAVLTVAASENLLLTGSKDRTAKLWDLQRSTEICTLGTHPNNVVAVRFSPDSATAFSVSMHQIRVWDLRIPGCVRVLQSCGQLVEGDGGEVGSRQNTVPFMDSPINAIELDSDGKLLLMSFKDEVKIWDMRKWGVYGKLLSASHSPKSEVSCIATSRSPEGSFVFTGSRDHYVKMFSIGSEVRTTTTASVEFSPPHYDNITCILPYRQHIFTASKDMNIMKFSLSDYKRDHLELKAHNGYIQAMQLIKVGGDDVLVSACKEGVIKLWDITTSRRMTVLEEIPRAHSDAINEFATNSSLLFSASSDQTVGFWRSSSN